MAGGRVKKARIAQFLRRHWRALALALIAVLGETLADVLEPWPIKIVVDSVLQSKRLPGWLDAAVASRFGTQPIAVLNFAVAAVAGIAIIGRRGSCCEKCCTTSTSQC